MQVYADNAATTKPSRTALDAMLPCFEQFYGNPSSLHHVGQAAAEVLLQARQDMADCPTIRRFALLHGRGHERERSTSFPPLLSTTPFCTRWNS